MLLEEKTTTINNNMFPLEPSVLSGSIYSKVLIFSSDILLQLLQFRNDDAFCFLHLQNNFSPFFPLKPSNASVAHQH